MSQQAAGPALDEATFAQLVERSQRELKVHCYRMLGSFHDAEDLVQETFLRAWRRRETYQGRASVRAWLYRIATNACLDFLDRHPRQPRASMRSATGADRGSSAPDELPWLSPYPDWALEPAAPSDTEPEAVVVAKETIELAFIVAIQYLPPKQRAALILADVLGWPAGEIAAALEVSTAAVNSALQRARLTLKERLPRRRLEWAPATSPTEAERALLRRYISATEEADPNVMLELLGEDVRVTMPPFWIVGRDNLIAWMSQIFNPASPMYAGQWRSLATRANRQPAVAHYVRRADDSAYRPEVLDVLSIEEGAVVQITSFGPPVFASFGLPAQL